MLNTDNIVKVTKGCTAHDFRKGDRLCVLRIETQERNRAYVVLRNLRSVVVRGYSAQHMNRLADPEIKFVYANPLESIRVQVVL